VRDFPGIQLETVSSENDSFSEENKLFSEENNPFSEENKPFAEENKLFSEENKSFSEENNPFSEESSSFSRQIKIRKLISVHPYSFIKSCLLAVRSTLMTMKPPAQHIAQAAYSTIKRDW